jgi:predicted anti-sigma-YlaC factor YlaD
MKNGMDCKTFQNELPDLVLTANARPSVAAVAHMRTCPPCAEEYLAFQATFAALDTWQAPEPSAYFDQKLAVRIREEQAAPRMSFLESLRARLLLNTGAHFRPIMVGALGLILLIGGGGIAGINYSNVPQQQPTASATVNDLQILDRNEQAFQQMDELQQDEDSGPQNDSAEPNGIQDNDSSAPAEQPAS